VSDDPNVPEISALASEAIESWQRVLAGAQGDPRPIFREAARDLIRLAIKHTEPNAADVIFAELDAMAAPVGIRLYEAEAIITEVRDEIDGTHTIIDAWERQNRGRNGSGIRADEPLPMSPDDYGTTDTACENKSAGADRFKVEMLDDIVLADDPVELVQGLLPMGPALGVTYGPPKSLKSFLLIHVGLHIADNRPYCGRAVQGGAVVYVTSEGIRGVRRRLIAARRAMGIEGRKVPFALVPTMPNLGAGEADRAALQQAISDVMRSIEVPLRMIVIDTMRRAMPGKSENKQEDVSIVIDNCEALARAFNCLVVLVHHSPRSNDERGSGSNAIDAAADVMWSVIRPDDSRRSATATVARYKDGEEGDAWTFELCRAELGTDREGNLIVSCSVDVTAEPERKIAATKSSPLSPAQQRVFDILLTATIEAGEAGLAGEAAPRGTRAVTKETLKAYAKKAGWWDDENDKSSRARFTARLNELAGKHAIGLTAEHVWPATKSANA
jgi:hypothetical protein